MGPTAKQAHNQGNALSSLAGRACRPATAAVATSEAATTAVTAATTDTTDTTNTTATAAATSVTTDPSDTTVSWGAHERLNINASASPVQGVTTRSSFRWSAVFIVASTPTLSIVLNFKNRSSSHRRTRELTGGRPCGGEKARRRKSLFRSPLR